MEITMRWHRLLRALAFAGGLVLGLGVAVFIFSNLSPIDVHWRIPSAGGYAVSWNLNGVSLWLLAIVPLLVGAVAGYFYQTPARMHHVREAVRHRHRVHELEHELKEARSSLDKLLMMPEDGRPSAPAGLLAPVEHRMAVSVEAEHDPRLPAEPAAVEVLAAKPVKQEPGVEAPVAAKTAKPRRRFFGGLKAEVAEIKLPAAIPATIVATPPGNGKAGNGKSKPAAAKPRARVVKKPS
jgi:hypothetical protein